jgi:GMP synthase (glutamine-hydrolysing)
MEKKECEIFVIDFGKHAKKFERMLKKAGAKAKTVKPTVSTKELKKADGFVLTGSKASVYEKNAPKFNKKVFSLKKPVLAVCYGHQLMAHALGGRVEKMKKKVDKKRVAKFLKKSPLFEGLATQQIVWCTHGDAVTRLPKGFSATAKTTDSRFAGTQNLEKNLFSIQFHPELPKTARGQKFIDNFVKIVRKNS